MIFLWITIFIFMSLVSISNIKFLSNPNCISVLYLLMFTIYGAGAVFSMNANFNNMVSDKSLMYCMLSILIMIVIMTEFSIIFSPKIRKIDILKCNLDSEDKSKKIYYIMLYIIIILLLYKVIKNGSVTYISMFIQRKMDTKLYWQLRGSRTGSDPKILETILNTFKFFVLSWSLVRWKIYNKKVYKLSTIFIVVIMIVYGLVDMHKRTIIEPLFVFLLYYYIVDFKKAKNKINKLIFGICIILFTIIIILPILYMIQYPSYSFGIALSESLNRVIIEPNRMLQLYFVFYPNLHDFLFGRSMSTLGRFFNNYRAEDIPLTYIPHYFGAKSAWNVCYIGDAWADFGLLGVIVYTIILMLFFYWVLTQLEKIKSRDFLIASIITLCYLNISLISVGIGAALNTFGLLWFAMFIKAVNFLNQRRYSN